MYFLRLLGEMYPLDRHVHFWLIPFLIPKVFKKASRQI